MIIIQNPQCYTLELTLGVVHSIGLDKCMTYIYHYSILQNSVAALKVFSALPIHPSLPPTPCQLLIFLLSPQFVWPVCPPAFLHSLSGAPLSHPPEGSGGSPLFKAHQWLLTILRIKSTLFNMAQRIVSCILQSLLYRPTT